MSRSKINIAQTTGRVYLHQYYADIFISVSTAAPIAVSENIIIEISSTLVHTMYKCTIYVNNDQRLSEIVCNIYMHVYRIEMYLGIVIYLLYIW